VGINLVKRWGTPLEWSRFGRSAHLDWDSGRWRDANIFGSHYPDQPFHFACHQPWPQWHNLTTYTQYISLHLYLITFSMVHGCWSLHIFFIWLIGVHSFLCELQSIVLSCPTSTFLHASWHHVITQYISLHLYLILLSIVRGHWPLYIFVIWLIGVHTFLRELQVYTVWIMFSHITNITPSFVNSSPSS